MQDRHGSKPTALSGYLEAMVRSIFTAGINWKVVETKWKGIREAFGGFDVEKVAALTPADIDRLAGDTRVIRNRRKIEAIVGNAAKMLALDKAPGGFAGYLRSHGDYKETIPTSSTISPSWAIPRPTSSLSWSANRCPPPRSAVGLMPAATEARTAGARKSTPSCDQGL